MILLELFLAFLKIGCFSFGGAYGAIPLIREAVLSHGWISEEALSHMIAVSESTPGPIMVNMATYIGSSQAGFAGALVATAAVVLPSFVIILILTALLKTAVKNPWVRAVLGGLKPCVVGIILATGLYLIWQNCVPEHGPDSKAMILTAVLAAVLFSWERLRKKKLSPIALILICACLGAAVYGTGYF
jgi:chromate transporter